MINKYNVNRMAISQSCIVLEELRSAWLDETIAVRKL